MPYTSDTPHYENRQVGEANVPFEVPKGWCWCKFQDCMDVRDGTHNSPKYINNGYPLITSKDFKEGRFDLSKTKYISEKDYQDIIKRSKVEVGDILYSMIGGNIGSMIRINQDNYFDMAIKNVALFKPYQNENINTKYIAYLLESKVREYQTIAIGGAQPFVGLDVFRNSLVPFPPLSEQHRIVAEIEKWFALIDAIESGKTDMQAAIKQAKSKILNLAIHGKLVPQDPSDEPASELLKRINPKAEITCDNGQYGKIPNRWTTIKIGDAANYINGRAFKPEEWMNEGTPIIRIQNLNDKTASYNYSTQLFESKYLIKNGDLLFAWAASLGTYIWDGEDAWLNQHIFKVEPKPFVTKEYLYYIFKAMISEFYNQSHGSGMVHITKKQFENIILFLPPLAEQHRIVTKIGELFAYLDNIQKSLEA